MIPRMDDDDDDDDDDDARQCSTRRVTMSSSYALSWNGRVVTVGASRAVVTVGRHTACELCVGDGDATVSRKHAEFRVDGGTGALEVRDLGSTHGTAVVVDAATRVEAKGGAWVCVLEGSSSEAEAEAEGCAGREVVLGKGATRVRATARVGDGAEASTDDEGSATEPDEDDGAVRRVIVDDMGELTQARLKRKTREPTMGEAELVYGELVVRDAGAAEATTTTTTTATPSSPVRGVNFKTFKKQSVAGMKTTSARRAPAEAYASVYEHERPMTEDEREQMKNAARADEEADDLFAMGLPSDAKAKRKAPVARKKKL